MSTSTLGEAAHSAEEAVKATSAHVHKRPAPQCRLSHPHAGKDAAKASRYPLWIHWTFVSGASILLPIAFHPRLTSEVSRPAINDPEASRTAVRHTFGGASTDS